SPSRSDGLRALIRKELAARTLEDPEADALGVVTLLYRHDAPNVLRRLTAAEHRWGEHVRSTSHVHLEGDACAEVVVLQGRRREVEAAARDLSGVRGDPGRRVGHPEPRRRGRTDRPPPSPPYPPRPASPRPTRPDRVGRAHSSSPRTGVPHRASPSSPAGRPVRPAPRRPACPHPRRPGRVRGRAGAGAARAGAGGPGLSADARRTGRRRPVRRGSGAPARPGPVADRRPRRPHGPVGRLPRPRLLPRDLRA
ncbi:protein containing Transcription factor, NikR, nickel binding protein, partial [mine drainage metagenome]